MPALVILSGQGVEMSEISATAFEKNLRPDDEVVLRRLRVFLAVVDAMSITGAARRLRVSQPAVTQQIRALEDDLRVRLFNRLGRSLALTDAGRKAVLVARELVNHVDDALANLRDAMRDQGLIMRIGFSAPQTALPAARAFHAFYPAATMELIAANTTTLFERLNQFDLDVILVGLEQPVEGYHCHLLVEQPLVAIVPQGPRWLGEQDLSLQMVCEEPLIIRERGSYTRQILLDAAAARGLEPRTSFEIATREAVNEAVAQGLGAATVLDVERPRDPRVSRIPIERGCILGREFVVCHKDLVNMPPISHFMEVLRDAPRAVLTV